MLLLITPVMVLWRLAIDNKYVEGWSAPYLDNSGVWMSAVNLGITQAIRIVPDRPKNHSWDFGNEKMSLTEVPRHKEMKEDSNSGNPSAASAIFAKDMLLGSGRRPR